jgi:hypothetical protein
LCAHGVGGIESNRLYRCDQSILSNFRRFSNYLFGIEFGAKEFGSSGVINGFNLMIQANDHFT